jgi:CBS domain-containing protein
MQVSEVMTTDVETVAPDDEVSDVLLKLGRAEYNGFPVTEDREARSASDGPSGDGPRGGRLVGIVTQSDLTAIFQPTGRTFWIPVGFPPFLESLEYGVKLPWDDLDVELDLARNAGRPISEFMTRDVVTVRPDDDLDAALDVLADDDRDINRLPVVDADNRVVGIVTRQDALAALRDARVV